MAGMTKESIQLKNVKIAWNMSEETTAFTATLYIDGKKAAHVKNDGTGGDNHPWFLDRKVEKEFHEFCKSLPLIQPEPEFEDMEPYPQNYDSFIGDLLTEWIEDDDWKKACKKGIVFTKHGEENNGKYWTIAKATYSKGAASHLRERLGEELKEIINERFI
tara:strand:+ start:55 stop:537 length:483 start_codon:yes stop_codon:yes gene_type:complete